MSCDCNESNFHAYGEPTGENFLLRVTGHCTCPRTGYRLHFEAANPGINPPPDEVVLRLVEDPPAVGEDTLTETSTDDFTTEISDDARWVVLRTDGGGFRIAIDWPGR